MKQEFIELNNEHEKLLKNPANNMKWMLWVRKHELIQLLHVTSHKTQTRVSKFIQDSFTWSENTFNSDISDVIIHRKQTLQLKNNKEEKSYFRPLTGIKLKMTLTTCSCLLLAGRQDVASSKQEVCHYMNISS